MTRHVDVAIVGAGPAGLTAARVVAEAGLSCLLIDRMGPGGELMNMGAVHDLPGLEPGATGPDLLAKLVDEAMSLGVDIGVDEVSRVDGIGPFSLATSEGEVAATALIIATGRETGTTGVADEARFEGRGLSHCATCDGPLYAGKRVVVAGHDRWAVEETMALAGIAAHVTLVASGDVSAEDRAGLAALANVALVQGRVTALQGGDALEAVTIGTESFPASALFVMANRPPATSCLSGLLRCSEGGHVACDAAGRTSVPGVYACGDVANPEPRIATAIAEGIKAGHNAVLWVQERALND